MQLRLFIALPILLALSGCSEEMHVQDQPPKIPGEIRATEVPGTEGAAETPEIELRDPVGLD